MSTASNGRFYPGLKIEYFPRAYKPGHLVTILAVDVQSWRTLIRFQYPDGREREVNSRKFHTEAYTKE